MQTIIVILILTLILGGASLYVIRAKKQGRKCVGCPHGGNCGNCKG